MGKPSNGPDLTDVETLMRAIGSLHTGTVGVVFSPRGIGSSGGVEVSCAMNFDVLPGSALPPVVMVTSQWPCADGHDFWSHVFDGLYKLDFEISKVYKNEDLWAK
jgi:hypothetical protein